MFTVLLVFSIFGLYIESSNAGCPNTVDVKFESQVRTTIVFDKKGGTQDECNSCSSDVKGNFNEN